MCAENDRREMNSWRQQTTIDVLELSQKVMEAQVRGGVAV
jgi:hypothetical protein